MADDCAKIKMQQQEACEEHIRQLLAQMTVEEKCMQMGQIVSYQAHRVEDGMAGVERCLIKAARERDILFDTVEFPLIG